MHHLRLILSFLRLSTQQEMAYILNFFINLLYSGLNLATGVLGLIVLFNQVQSVHGWTLSSSLALLGVYLILGALRDVVFSPSFDALAGLGGEVWNGRFDFTLLRPVNLQFLTSFRYWRIFSCIDLLLGLGVLGFALVQLHSVFAWLHILVFLVAMVMSVVVLYSILLLFTSLIFWSPGFLFTWVFNGIFQMARYPVGLYPGWVRLLLTWVIPIGIMTTLPAQILNGDIPLLTFAGGAVFAVALLVISSLLFQQGAKRYASASS